MISATLSGVFAEELAAEEVEEEVDLTDIVLPFAFFIFTSVHPGQRVDENKQRGSAR
ncbi:MAG: hypothetical protein U0441_24930 [Polyangiaceae bacterium]